MAWTARPALTSRTGITRKSLERMAFPDCITILVHEWVTGGGLAGLEIRPSWLAEGRAIRRAVAADFAAVAGSGVRVIMTLDDRWSDETGPWTTVPIGACDSTGRIIELARQADYTVLIAPETTGVLARLARSLEGAGTRSLGCSPESIELTGDKLLMGAWLSEQDLPTPSCRRVTP